MSRKPSFTVITPWKFVLTDKQPTFYEDLLLAAVAASCFVFAGLWFLA